MKSSSNKTKQVTRKAIETLINNKKYFRITSSDSSVTTAVGYVGGKSLRISIVYYLKSVVFTDLVDNENQLIYALI